MAHGVYYVLEEYPGKMVYYLFYGIVTFYYIFQLGAYYYVIIFINYSIFKDVRRTKKLIRLVWGVIIAYTLILMLNLRFHEDFDSTKLGNRFFHGDIYYIQLIISYSPVVWTVYDFISAVQKNIFKKRRVYLVVFFVLLTGISSIIDRIWRIDTLIWPCFSASLLYSYFFIIRMDAQIDSLTGIGNRHAFNAFIDKLSRLNTQASYSIVMMDMDHFKQINDTLGHVEGDNALRDMASIIKSCIRDSDFAARYGGDEFILAIRAEKDIENLMARIQQAIDAHNGKHLRSYQIQMSYGHDVYTTNSGQLIQDFLSHIDALMYKNKGAGRRKSDTAG
jgi:diguanylate cyclase (GGDEF)-like protein